MQSIGDFMKMVLICLCLSFNVWSKTAPTKEPKAVATKEVKATTSSEILQFKASDGKVGFIATGRPAMIKIIGESEGPTGQLNLSNDKVSGKLILDMTKLTTKIDLRDDHMKNKYLEVGKFPTSEILINEFSITKSELSSSIKKEFNGELTMHGITKPVKGEIELSEKNKLISAKAKFKINIMDFLSTLPSYAGIKVADETEITVDISTLRQ